jgi:hypothetical protein
MTWVDANVLNEVEPSIRQLYNDFCVLKGNELGCPKNFNALTVGWYLNHSKENANVGCDENFDFITVRDVSEGEELLSDYTTYGNTPIAFEVK